MQMIFHTLLQNKHVASGTYERGIYAVVIFSTLKCEKGRGFQGCRNIYKNYLTGSSFRQRRDSDLERKTKNFYILHVKVINMKFVMSISAQIDK